jgi:hypothetical protein
MAIQPKLVAGCGSRSHCKTANQNTKPAAHNTAYGRRPGNSDRQIKETHGTIATHASGHQSKGGKAIHKINAPKNAGFQIESVLPKKMDEAERHENHRGSAAVACLFTEASFCIINPKDREAFHDL